MENAVGRFAPAAHAAQARELAEAAGDTSGADRGRAELLATMSLAHGVAAIATVLGELFAASPPEMT